ncbi:MAG: YggT family protein [Actinomycetota bacterium]|nr:YggT family protein [Actinomycetota bacterium]
MSSVAAGLPPLLSVVSNIRDFVNVFILVYALLIFVYILTSWIRLPYSPTLNRIQRFLYDVCEPYLRVFRRFVPPLGPLDLSPMVAILVLFLLLRIVNAVFDRVE